MTENPTVETQESVIEKPIFHQWAVEIREMQTEITDKHGGICKAADALCVMAWRIGKRLMDCRQATVTVNGIDHAAIPHGIWTTFIDQCGLDRMTAWRYTTLAKRFATEQALMNEGLRKGYLAMLVPPGKARAKSAVVRQTRVGRYMQAANDLHKVLNNLGRYNVETLRTDLRLLFEELQKLYGGDTEQRG